MTSKEWAKQNPERWKQHQLKYREAHRSPCKSCGGVREHKHTRYCNLCSTTTQIVNKNAQHRLYRKNLCKKYTEFKKKLGCAKCRYNKCGAALDFHHIDPKLKERRITAPLWFSNTNLYINELKKCNLLCKNCHYEVHHENE